MYPENGGVEKHIQKVAQILSKKYELSVITTLTNLELSEFELIWGNIKCYRMPSYTDNKFKKFQIWKWLFIHRDILRGASVIHAHDVFFWIFPFVFGSKFKKYITFHGWETKFPIPRKNIIIRKISEKLADGNICIGDFITKWYGTKADIISYGGVDPARYPIKSSNTLLFSGRLDRDTGFDTCVEVYKHLKPRYHWKLHVVGDGPNRKLAPKDAKLFGFVKDPEKHVSTAKFVFTTGYLGILEAFAYKKLVISTYDNPLKKDYLLLHPMAKNMVIGKDWEEIVKKLQTLSDSQIQGMIRTAYNWSRQQTWEKVARQHEQLWSK